MEAIREYLIGVIAAALLCGIVSSLIPEKSTVGSAVKLTAGFLMLLAVLRPWTSIRPEGLFRWAEDISADCSGIVAEGEAMGMESYRESIIRQLEAYILKEAEAYDCHLDVEISLSTDAIPVPSEIRFFGEVSPFARQALKHSLSEKLGLSREDLIWT